MRVLLVMRPPRRAPRTQYRYRESPVPRHQPGERTRRAPEGWNELPGSLSVGGRNRGPVDPPRAEQLAGGLGRRLDVLVAS